MNARRLSTRLLLFCLALTAILIAQPAAASFKYLHKGMTLPEMKGKDLITGDKVTCGDGDEHESAVVVMAFWATWSPRSLEVLSDLKVLQSKFGADKVHVIAINVEGNRVDSDANDRIVARVKELDLPYPVIRDKDLEIYDTVGVIAVPSVAVLDSRHVLRCGPSGYSGAIADLIEDAVAQALGLGGKQEAGDEVSGYRPNARANRYYNMAVQLVNQRRFKRALSNLDRAVAADSNFSPPHLLMGQIHLATGDLPASRDSYARAAGLDATAAGAWAGWGRALLRMDKSAEAVAKLEAALAREESYTPALLDLAAVRAIDGNRTGARDLLDQVLALNPRNPEVLLRLGKFHRQSGNSAAAVEAYRAALEQLIQ
jgi:Tfp pilus assembly protein PilF/peroxiredoxin